MSLVNRYRNALRKNAESVQDIKQQVDNIKRETKRIVSKWKLPKGFKELYVDETGVRGVSIQFIREGGGFLPTWIQVEDGKIEVTNSDHKSRKFPFNTPVSDLLVALWKMQRPLLK